MITLGSGSRDEFGNPIPSGTYFIADEGDLYSQWRTGKNLIIEGSHSGSYFDWDTKTSYSSARHQGGTAWANTQQNIQQEKENIQQEKERQEIASNQYRVGGVAVSQREYQQRKLEAQQRASTNWQQQNVVSPRYYVSQGNQAMQVSPELYKKFTTDVDYEGKSYQQMETTNRTGYSETGKIKVIGTAVEQRKTGIAGFYQGIEENARMMTRSVLPKTEEVFKPYSEIRSQEVKLLGIDTSEKPVKFVEISEATKEFMWGYTKGTYRMIRDEPMVVVEYYALGRMGGFVFGGATTGVSYFAKAVGKEATIGAGWEMLQVGVGGAMAFDYVGKKAVEYKSLPSLEAKGEMVGGEVLKMGAMAYGFKTGETDWLKVKGLWETRQMQQLPLERITPKEVATGKVNYWNQEVSKHQKLFESGQYSLPKTNYDIAQLKVGKVVYDYTTTPRDWHASTSLFADKFEVTAGGNSTFQALYVSPQLSIPFLKLSQQTDVEYGLSQGLGNFPAGYNIQSLGHKWLPKGSLRVKKQFFYNEAEKGFAYMGTGKTEVEAIHPLGSIVVKENIPRTESYWTFVEGVRVPLKKYFVLPEGVSSLNGAKIITRGNQEISLATSGIKTETMTYQEFLGMQESSLSGYSSVKYTPMSLTPSMALSSSTPRVSTPSVSYPSSSSIRYPSASAPSYPPSYPSSRASSSSVSSILSSMSRASSSAVSSASSSTARSPSISRETSSALSRASSTGTSTSRTPSRSSSYSGITQKIPDMWGKMKQAKPKPVQFPTPKPRGLFYQAGFTEKTLGIKKVVTGKQLVKMAKKMYSYQWRPIPIIKKTRRVRKR